MGIVNLWFQLCCKLQGACVWLLCWQWQDTNTEDGGQPELITAQGSTGVSGSCRSTAVRAALQLNICSAKQKNPPSP